MDTLKELIEAAEIVMRLTKEGAIEVVYDDGYGAIDRLDDALIAVKAQQSKTVRVWVRVNDKGEAWAKVAENGMYWFMNSHMAQEMFGTLPSKNHEGQYGITLSSKEH